MFLSNYAATLLEEAISFSGYTIPLNANNFWSKVFNFAYDVFKLIVKIKLSNLLI